MVGLPHYLIVAAIMMCCGVGTILLKRNAIGILLGVELILNAANVNLVAFNRYNANASGNLDGQIFAIFVIVLAAAEAAVALAIFLNFYHRISSIDIDRGDQLKG